MNRPAFRTWSRLGPLIALGLAAGCSAPTVAPVAGRVTLDDKPLPGVHVSFQPIATEAEPNPGVGSYAITDDQGRFQLRLIEGDRPGAVVGNHRVEVTSRTETGDEDRRGKRIKTLVPAKYNRDSQLTFVVPPGGTAEANFDLKP